MPWFKVDDRLHSHPKWLAASMAARGLWVTAGSWCAGNSHDGDVPRSALKLIGGTPKAAGQLVALGLWETTDTGWRFHDWSHFQPTTEQVMATRRSDAARQRVARSPELRQAIRDRDGNRCRYCGETVRWNDRRGPLGGTYDHVIPDGESDLNNLVVCCRACNASKGRRVPDQAGMALRPGSGARSDLDPIQVRDLDRPRPPTRPDPTRTSVGTGLNGSPPLAPAAAEGTPDSEGVDYEHHDRPRLEPDRSMELVAGIRQIRGQLAPPDPEDAA